MKFIAKNFQRFFKFTILLVIFTKAFAWAGWRIMPSSVNITLKDVFLYRFTKRLDCWAI